MEENIDKVGIMFHIWEELRQTRQNRDVFLFFCHHNDNELMQNSLISLDKVQNGIMPCPWRKN